MAVKLTKNELKAQRDALKRFQRYLPTLQLKKQQLQMEIRTLEHKMAELDAREKAFLEKLEPWVSLFSNEPLPTGNVAIEVLETTTGNIAGVNIPVLKTLKLRIEEPDFETTEPWFDDAIAVLKARVEFNVEREILKAQWDRLSHELRITNQRVNLFEKIKIPEAKENIRMIRIYLGDQQTAGVARAKIAKRKSTEGGE
jgi:V/A-type H+-transporting ATPase subunit D